MHFGLNTSYEINMSDTLIKQTAQTSVQTQSLFDIVKFILALSVVAIHTRFMDYILYPWLRIAVPLFFIISGYFLFGKLYISNNQYTSQKNIIKNFVLRNLKLYVFWFIILLPGTLKIRQYFSKGFLNGAITFVRSFLFDSTFVASWFIMATIIATLIIFVFSKKISTKMLLIITAIIYILTALRSSYFLLLQNYPFVIRSISLYETIFYPAYNSFPVALYWITCGKYFAETPKLLKLKYNVVLTVISSISLYIEWYMLKRMTGIYNADCYIMLLPLCTFLFACIKQIKPFYLQFALYLRKISVITFALHGTLISLGITRKFFPLIDWINISSESKNFLVTTSICIFVSIVILILEKKRYFKWLKYSH